MYLSGRGKGIRDAAAAAVAHLTLTASTAQYFLHPLGLTITTHTIAMYKLLPPIHTEHNITTTAPRCVISSAIYGRLTR